MPVDLDDYRDRSLENWNRISGNWDDERDYIWSATRHVSERLVELADPQPGDTVLDIAAGTGDTGFLAAERIGSEGKLITTDFSSGMVDAARKTGEERGLDNAEYRVLDAERMDLDDSSVDRVVCRFGYMLMADPAAALAETRRVLRDDGRVAFAVWASPQENPWAAIPGMTMVELGHIPPPEPGAPGIFALADTERVTELVTGAGFGEPEISQVEVQWPYAEPARHWELTMKLAGPLADAINGLDDDARQATQEAVAARVQPLIESGNGEVPGLVHVIKAS